jgi:hypothetical protein
MDIWFAEAGNWALKDDDVHSVPEKERPRRGNAVGLRQSALLRNFYRRPAAYDHGHDYDEKTFQRAFALYYQNMWYKAKKLTHINFERRDHIFDQLLLPGRGLLKKAHRAMRQATNVPESAPDPVPEKVVERKPVPVHSALAGDDPGNDAMTNLCPAAPETVAVQNAPDRILPHLEQHAIRLDGETSAHSDLVGTVSEAPTAETPTAVTQIPSYDEDRDFHEMELRSISTPRLLEASSQVKENVSDERTGLEEGIEAITLNAENVIHQPSNGCLSSGESVAHTILLPKLGTMTPYMQLQSPDLPPEPDLPVSDRSRLPNSLPTDASSSKDMLDDIQQLAPGNKESYSSGWWPGSQGSEQAGPDPTAWNQHPNEYPTEPDGNEYRLLGTGPKRQRTNPFEADKRIICAVWARDPRNALQGCHGYSAVDVSRMKNACLATT